MIYTWEVSAWRYRAEEGRFDYTMYWSGNSLLFAILAMVRAKKKGFKYVKLEWQ